MNSSLEAWLAHAETYKRSAIVGVSLGGPEKHLVFQQFDNVSDSDFEDIATMLFLLFSGREDAPLAKRLQLMDTAYQTAKAAVVLAAMPAAGEA